MFFFKQKTAYEMRISDWSSDVCSSDLLVTFHQYLAKVTRCSARNTGRMLSRTIAPLMNKAILDDHTIRSRGVAAYPYRRSTTQITTNNRTSVRRTRLRLKEKIKDGERTRLNSSI